MKMVGKYLLIKYHGLAAYEDGGQILLIKYHGLAAYEDDGQILLIKYHGGKIFANQVSRAKCV